MQYNDTSLYTSNAFSVSWFMWYMLHSSQKKCWLLTCFKLITCECVRAQFKRLKKKDESVENQMFLVTYERRKPSRNRNSGVKGASVKKQKQTCCVPVQVLFESIKRKSLTSFMVSFFPWSGKHAKGHIKYRTSGVWCTHRTYCCPILHFIWWYCCHWNWGTGGKRVWVMIREYICEKIIS